MFNHCIVVQDTQTNDFKASCMAYVFIEIYRILYIVALLTHNTQAHRVALHRLRGHLTLVHALVARLRPLDLHRPLADVAMVAGLEALIGGVRVRRYRQDVQVAVSYPRDLQCTRAAHTAK